MKLETGKYYLGSDGKKYGPMRCDGVYFYDESEILWSYYGEGGKDPNLIAEWDAQEQTSTSHFAHMLSDMQGIAKEYGYTIVETSGGENSLCVDLVKENP